MVRWTRLIAALAILLVIGTAVPNALAAAPEQLFPLTFKTALAAGRSYSFTFTIWSARTDGSKLSWSEGPVKLVVNPDKTIHHLLGSKKALPALDYTEQYWIQAQTGSKKYRTNLPAAGYAFWSDQVNTAPLDARYVQLGQADGVTAEMIADGQVSAAKIDSMGGASTQVLTADGAGGASWQNAPGSTGVVASVHAGAGLSGSATTGDVTLSVAPGEGILSDESGVAVSYAGTGSAPTASRSDHGHAGYVTGVIAGTGLTGGGSGGALSLGLDTAYTDGRYLPAAGGTMSGNLVLNTGADADLTLSETGISRGDDLTISAEKSGAPSTVTVTNPNETQVANLDVEGAVSAAAFTGDGSGLTNLPAGAHEHDAAYVNEGQADAITGAMIADGQVSAAKIDISGGTAGQVLTAITGGGASWQPVPGGDITGVTAGTGLTGGGDSGTVAISADIGTGAGTVAAGDHLHDARYFPQSTLTAAGTINNAGNPVDWSKLKNVPASLADGVDNDTTYSPGDGLQLTGNTFSADFGTGTTQVAAGNHAHAATSYSKAEVDALLATRDNAIATLASQVAALQTLLMHFSRSGNEITISGANLHIADGSGTTDGGVNGLGNVIIGYNALRGGGDVRTGSHNLVVGDKQNYSSYGGMVAGLNNAISGAYSTVSGGVFNTASAFVSSVSGGIGNNASGSNSSVSGGLGNTASGRNSSVSGGSSNTASGDSSSVSGGRFNTASARHSSVSGGGLNTASGDTSSVSGGEYNLAKGQSSSVAGGGGSSTDGNKAVANYSAVLGGRANVAGDMSAIPDPGIGQYSTVSGGSGNSANGSASYVGGGGANTAIGEYSSVSGGYSNSASGQFSSISAGNNNLATGMYSSVVGGRDNTASGEGSSVIGGGANTASGNYALVSGGATNTAGAHASSVSGGTNRSVIGDYDWRAGDLFQDQ